MTRVIKLGIKRPVYRPLLPDPEPREVKYTLISVDDHLMEPPHTFEGRLPRALQERAPRVEETEEGHQVWVFEDKSYFQVGFMCVAGRPFGLRQMATYFGPLTYRVESSPSSIDIQLDPPARQAPRELLLHVRLPEGQHMRSVTLNGAPCRTGRCAAPARGHLAPIRQTSGAARSSRCLAYLEVV